MQIQESNEKVLDFDDRIVSTSPKQNGTIYKNTWTYSYFNTRLDSSGYTRLDTGITHLNITLQILDM